MTDSDTNKIGHKNVQQLVKSPYYKSLDAKFLATALQDAPVTTLEKNQTLIAEGDQTDKNLYILIEGELTVSKDGKPLLTLKEPGQLIGEMSLLENSPRYATVTANVPTTVFSLNSDFINAPDNVDPKKGLVYATLLSRVLSEKLRITSDKAKLYEDAIFESQQKEEYTLELKEEIQEKLRQIKLYSKTVENNLDAVLITDNQGHITLWNQAAITLFEATSTALQNQHISECFEDLVSRDTNISEQFKHQWKCERNAIKLDGTHFPTFISISPISEQQNQGEAITHYAFSIKDMTLRKEYEENLLQKNVELKTTHQALEETVSNLEKSNRIKDEFFSNVSAQLKTPLITINSFTEALLKELDNSNDSSLKDFLERIQKEERKLENMVENILTMSEISNELSTLSLNLYNIEELLSAVSSYQNIHYTEKRNTNQLAKQTFLGDITKLRRALLDGLDYIKNSQKNIEQVFLYNSYNLAKEAHQIIIAPTAVDVGPTPDYKINEAFVDLDEEVSIYLSVAKRIISAHKGEISLVPYQAGLYLRILLPSEPEKGLISSPKIVIIDDNNDDREHYKAAINVLVPEVEIFEFDHQMTALTSINAIRPDVVIVDPDFKRQYFDEQTFMKELIKTCGKNSELFIISNKLHDESYRSRTLEYDIKDYLAKPYTQTELAFRFKNVLHAHQQLSILFNNIKKAQKSAITDQLTQVFNRRYYDEFMQEQLIKAQMEGSQCSVLLLDIDNFKQYNDVNGHQVGDEGLKITAKLLKKLVRKNDMVARYGGEEFVVVLPNTSKSMATLIAEKIRKAVEHEPYPGEENQPNGKVTTSIGVATYENDGKTAEVLLKSADQCLYTAKEKGRNCVITA